MHAPGTVEPASTVAPQQAEPLAQFLAERAHAGHVLVLVGGRSSAHLVADQVWARAAARGHLLVTVGRRLLSPARAADLARPTSAVVALPEPPWTGAGDWQRRLAECLRTAALRGCRGAVVLAAPSAHAPGGLRGLDGALDEAVGAAFERAALPSVERYCLLPTAWLRHEGPRDAMVLLEGHPERLFLP